MMCDSAGWHDERALTVPDNVTLALLPPYVPPSSGYWLYLRGPIAPLLDDTERQSTPVAKHGSTSSQNRIVCEPSAPIHGS